MSKNIFCAPEEIRPLYQELISAYQVAFAGEPWREVSKCADDLKRCVGGLSSLAIGATCQLCGNCPNRPAYESEELVERFESIATSRPTSWYAEQNDNGLTLAAIAWKADLATIADEKYQDTPEMKAWLELNVGAGDIVWLDEVFANKTLKISGNLRNFEIMCRGMTKQLASEVLAFRTINPAMIRASTRDFGKKANVFKRFADVPDRRDFVILSIKDD